VLVFDDMPIWKIVVRDATGRAYPEGTFDSVGCFTLTWEQVKSVAQSLSQLKLSEGG
jgi:hypothetical protein